MTVNVPLVAGPAPGGCSWPAWTGQRDVGVGKMCVVTSHMAPAAVCAGATARPGLTHPGSRSRQTFNAGVICHLHVHVWS